MARSSYKLRQLRGDLEHAERMLRHANRSSYRVGQRDEWTDKVQRLRLAVGKERELLAAQRSGILDTRSQLKDSKPHGARQAVR